MLNFKLVESSVDTQPILNELKNSSRMWYANTSRQENVRCQRHTANIFLRVAKKPLPAGEKNANNVHQSVTTRKAKELFTNTYSFCLNFAREIEGELGRATLVALSPNRQVYPHIDHGEYYRIRDRYHLVVSSSAGSPLTAGEETVVMREGELWVFNNKVRHSAFNTSGEQRVHLIFDILPPPGKGIFSP